tara:strand:- start:6843 stop:8087 length:1245 start_codon:yes stop_codon:yes gene_type:complete
MHFLIISPFLSLRGEGFISRHISIAEHLASLGNEVSIITSKFRHNSKINRNFSNYFENGVKYYFINETGYKENRSLKRFLSHFIFSINTFIFLLKLKIFKKYSFNAIIVTLPLGFLSLLVGIYCKLFSFKFFIDLQDKWPDIFVIYTHNIPFPFNKIIKKLILYTSKKIRRNLCRLSDGTISVSEEYFKWYFSNVPNKLYIHHILRKKLYLGSQFKINDFCFKRIDYTNKNKINLLVFGSLVESYDFKLIIDATKNLNRNYSSPRYFLKIIGKGILYEELKQVVCSYEFIDLYEEIPFKNLKSFILDADFLINPLRKNATQSISNRLCDYLVTQKPILTSYLPKELVEAKLNLFVYEPDNIFSLTNLIEEIVKGKYFLSENNIKSIYQFHRNISYPEFINSFIFNLKKYEKLKT